MNSPVIEIAPAPTAETAIATIAPAMPSNEVVRRNVNGKKLGVRWFAGKASATELKKALKATGKYTARELGAAVNEALRDEGANRRIVAHGMVAAIHEKGGMIDFADETAGGYKLTFVKVAAAPKPAEDAGMVAKLMAMLAERGVSAEDMAAAGVVVKA